MPRKSAASSPPSPWRSAPRPNCRTLAPSTLLLWEKATRTMSGLALRLRPIGSQGEGQGAGKAADLDERFRLEHWYELPENVPTGAPARMTRLFWGSENGQTV
jgi:hypothetical protein